MPCEMISQLLSALQKDGFVIVRSLVSADQLSSLRTAATETTRLARSGAWPHVRTLPKQFPPWTIPLGSNPAEHGIWGVQGLLNPSLPQHEIFTQNYFSSAILDVVKELLLCADDDLVMELFNLLVRPDHDFELRWHRDDIPATAGAGEETTRLQEPAWHAQWNLCLYDDESLIVVPGSHSRPRTEAERAAGPFEKEMPGQKIVMLRAGDAVFYDNNILHRGVYDSKIDRMTLHGSVGHVKGNAARARNVLQHGVGEWVGNCNFSILGDGERERAENMRKRLVSMGKIAGDVGYSQAE